MKKSILILVALGIATAVAIHIATRSVVPLAAGPVAVAEPSPPGMTSNTPPPAAARAVGAQRESSASNDVAHTPPPASLESIAFAADIDTLASSHSTYAEKQAAWKELLAAGRIQDAVAELEQRAANDPKSAEVAAALGQAYLKACATTQDVRSQAIWAMQGDRAFDTALSLDPSNWDARFAKAVAMTYWPANLNKGPEIVSQFNTLIQQQEQQTPQPQFAQTYDWLGQHYALTGQPELAQQVWQRGASLFPDNEALQSRLAAPQAARQ